MRSYVSWGIELLAASLGVATRGIVGRKIGNKRKGSRRKDNKQNVNNRAGKQALTYMVTLAQHSHNFINGNYFHQLLS